MPVISRGALRALRFPSNTVPSLAIDGRKLTGSREIAGELDRLRPDPPLYPTEPEHGWPSRTPSAGARRSCSRPIRRISWNVLKRDGLRWRAMPRARGSAFPIGLAVKTGGPIVAAANRMNSADDETVRADLAALPGWLKRIDDWIAEGVLGAEPPNAADLQIGASLRLAMTLRRPAPGDRGAPGGRAGHARRPRVPGHAPPGPAAGLARARCVRASRLRATR